MLMTLNRASGEGNLTASHECPATYVSLSPKQVDINIILTGERVDPSVPEVGWASGGLRVFQLPWLNPQYELVCERPVINGASFGLLHSSAPSDNVNNKRESGIIRPPDARGVRRVNHVT